MNMISLLIDLLIETPDGWFVFVERLMDEDMPAFFHKKLVFCIKNGQTLYDAFCMKYVFVADTSHSFHCWRKC